MKTKLMASIAVILLGILGARLYFARVSARSMEALQTFALAVLRNGHPDWHLERSGKNGIQLQSHGVVGHIYLDNILREAGSDRSRARELIEQSAQTLSEQPEMNNASSPLPRLGAVKSRLRPMLVPRSYADQYELAARPFAGDTVETLVIDDKRSTRYVRSQDLKTWQTELEPLRQLAETALWQDSQALKLEAQTPADGSKPGKFLTIATRGGQDIQKPLSGRVNCPI